MIAVDTNVIGYLFLTGEKSALAELAFRRDPAWAAPLLWRSEMRNVLAHYLRKNLLSLPDGQQIMSAAASLMHGREYEVTSAHVLELVAASACSAYDCEFVALARDLNVPLVTADREILKNFAGTAISLEAFLGSS